MKWLVNWVKLTIGWTIVNGRGLVDELHFVAALGSEISEELFAQPQYYALKNLQKIVVETDKRYMKHNGVSLASLIRITENRDGWLNKANVEIDKNLFAKVKDQLPNSLLIFLPNHFETISVRVQK